MSAHLSCVLGVVAAWLAIGAIGLAALRREGFVANVLFPLGALLGLALSALALAEKMGVLPPRVVILAVEGELFSPDARMSPSVVRSLPGFLVRVREELDHVDEK